ncbi:transposase family protein [Streptomyces viridosporus]|uniref:Predicted protein n=1 Tax=Streptomyces viridosporus (strain ATCC 14672 / DSM 40746 / JCM 4963 / KCTC 9882 / NRRL B-12104 / FH 1290) TaxID=566461 RepID=D5ZNV8_STRV1|nr:predicted protein [Streptomyces viridosporus ATCC 14672]
MVGSALPVGAGQALPVAGRRSTRRDRLACPTFPTPHAAAGYKAARNRPLTRSQKLSDKVLAAVRAPVEHSFAHLKNWRVLGKVRTDPKWATALVRAMLVLTNHEVAR